MGTQREPARAPDRRVPDGDRLHRGVPPRPTTRHTPAVVADRCLGFRGRHPLVAAQFGSRGPATLPLHLPGGRGGPAPVAPHPRVLAASWRHHQRIPPLGSSSDPGGWRRAELPAGGDGEGVPDDLPRVLPGRPCRGDVDGFTSDRTLPFPGAEAPRPGGDRRGRGVPGSHLSARPRSLPAVVRALHRHALRRDRPDLLPGCGSPRGARRWIDGIPSVRSRPYPRHGLARSVRRLRGVRLPGRPGSFRHGERQPHRIGARTRTPRPDPRGGHRFRVRRHRRRARAGGFDRRAHRIRPVRDRGFRHRSSIA